jgi:hypothetical protein
MEIIITVINALVALINLITARLRYKAETSRDLATDVVPPPVLGFSDPNVRTKPWNMRRVKWLLFILSALWAVFIVTFTIVRTHDLSVFVFNALGALLLVDVVITLRDQPPSRTLKTIEFTLAGDRKRVLAHCKTALEKIGTSVGEYDPAAGIIVARTSWNWRSPGEIIRVEASELNPAETSVRIQSDTIQPSLVFDWGANARNIGRLKALILGTTR